MLYQQNLPIRSLQIALYYTEIFEMQRKVMDAISKGDANAALAAFRKDFSLVETDSKELQKSFDTALLFCQIKGWMFLSVLLTHGYHITLPVNQLYVIFEIYTLRLLYMRKEHELDGILCQAIQALCDLVQQQNSSMHDKIVWSACQYIHNNLSAPLTEDIVAQAAKISRSRLNNRFKQELNCTIYEYIIRQKIYSAADMLSNSTLPVSFIAAELSFSSSSHLGKVFKKYTGLTPIQYRKRVRHYRSQEDAGLLPRDKSMALQKTFSTNRP